MSRTHFLQAARPDHHSELTLSLPSMGPNFNFYKFKGLSEAYQSKFRATQHNLRQVNTVLAKQWGHELKNYNPFGMNLPAEEEGDAPHLVPADDPQAFLLARERAALVDNKGLSPLNTSPRVEVNPNGKEVYDYHSMADPTGGLRYPPRAGTFTSVAKMAQKARDVPSVDMRQKVSDRSPRALSTQYNPSPPDARYGGSTGRQIDAK